MPDAIVLSSGFWISFPSALIPFFYLSLSQASFSEKTETIQRFFCRFTAQNLAISQDLHPHAQVSSDIRNSSDPLLCLLSHLRISLKQVSLSPIPYQLFFYLQSLLFVFKYIISSTLKTNKQTKTN